MKRILYIICIAFVALPSYGQVNDSLVLDSTDVREMIKKGLVQFYAGKLDSAIFLGNQALELSQELNFQSGVGESTRALGSFLCFQGDYDEATTHFQAGLKAFKVVGNKRGEAGILGNLGNVYFGKGLYGKALDFHVQALDLFEALNDENGIAITTNCLGTAYIEQKRYDKALHYFEIADSLSEKVKSPLNVMSTKINIGDVYVIKENFNLAQNYYEEALAVAIALEHELGISFVRRSLGKMHLESGNLLQAKEELSAALDLFITQKDQFRQAEVKGVLGDLALLENDPELAIQLNHEALDIAIEIDASDIIKDAYGSLSKAYEISGNAPQALKYERLATAMKDSLFNVQQNAEIVEMQERYDAASKDVAIAELGKTKAEAVASAERGRQWLITTIAGGCIAVMLIVLLVVRNKSRRKHQEAEFMKQQADLEQQALLARMNPHFLFNSLSSMQFMYVNGNMKEANEFMADFSLLLRKILAHTGVKQISVREEIHTLQLYMNLERERLEKKMEFSIHVDDGIDLDGSFIPPMIIQPFVENAIWHGIVPKGSGTIEITLDTSDDENRLVCQVKDNGVGFQPKGQQVNTKPSIRENKGETVAHESSGIKLTEQRLGGKVEISSVDGGGTLLRFLIPVDNG